MKHFKLEKNKVCTRTVMTVALTALMATVAFATDGNGTFDSVVNPIVDLLQALVTPALAIVGAVGTLYCILLGVKFAKAEEPQDREKAKTHLKNAIIGFVLIFVLIVALHFGLKVMKNWAYQQTGIKY